ncbi:hypothetical protein BDV93DRAFT_573600 [Ceratobasidium sp. AG-I]|nr:hypothetical protein BDV93DRAFT_573600 [Ceratobasidium sp. AG-I]
MGESNQAGYILVIVLGPYQNLFGGQLEQISPNLPPVCRGIVGAEQLLDLRAAESATGEACYALFGSKEGNNPTNVNYHDFLAFCNTSSAAGEEILCSSRTATEWIIQRGSHNETQSTISPKYSPHLFWGYPETGIKSTLHLREGAENSRSIGSFTLRKRITFDEAQELNYM